MRETNNSIPDLRMVVHDSEMRKIWIAGLLACTLLTGCAESAEEKNMRNLDTGMVRIEIEGHRFNIPLRYMYGEAVEKWGNWPTPKKGRTKVDALALSVLLPDLKPYYPEDDARWKVSGHGERLEVTIMKPVGREDWYEWLRQQSSHEATQGKSVRGSDVYALIHYSERVFDSYFPVGPSKELVIHCDRQKPGFFPSCKTKSNYRRGVVLEYYYGLDHLPRWREIDDGLKAMFDRFAEAAQTEQPNKGE